MNYSERNPRLDSDDVAKNPPPWIKNKTSYSLILDPNELDEFIVLFEFVLYRPIVLTVCNRTSKKFLDFNGMTLFFIPISKLISLINL